MNLEITKRELYLGFSIISVFICLTGAVLNVTAVRNNDCMMPVYAGRYSIPMDDTHFVFTNKSSVNFFYFTDIFSTPFFGTGYFSIGDVMYYLGMILIPIFLFNWFILVRKESN